MVCFAGPLVFLPMSIIRAGNYPQDEYRKTVVRRGASIGANAAIVCGYDLGA